VGRRSFTAEFKHEAVKLVRERGVAISQAAEDLGLHYNVLRKWVNDAKTNGRQAFPGRGKQRPDDAEISRLRRELAKAQTERDILKKAIAYFAKEPR
jgi:transposase